MRPIRTAVSLGLAFALAGCSTTGDAIDPTDPADEPAAEIRFGLVTLTHEAEEAGVAVSGQLFVARGHTRATALHAVMQPDAVWLTEAIDEGTCRMVRTPQNADGGPVDLLSVGELTVSTPGVEEPLRIAARAFPPVSFASSGVVYDIDAPEALPYRSGRTYRADAVGDELGRLSGEVTAPRALFVDGVDIDRDGLTIRWDDAEPIVALLSRDLGDGTIGVHCADRGGDLTVPPGMLAALGAGEAQLTVARLERSPLTIDGLGDAELLFIDRQTVAIQVSDEVP